MPTGDYCCLGAPFLGYFSHNFYSGRSSAKATMGTHVHKLRPSRRILAIFMVLMLYSIVIGKDKPAPFFRVLQPLAFFFFIFFLLISYYAGKWKDFYFLFNFL